MKFRTAAVLLAIASVAGVSKSASADTPGAQVRGMDSYAPDVPSIETTSMARPERRAVKRNERRSKLRKVAREKVSREHARPHANGEPPHSRSMSAVAVHNDGDDFGMALPATSAGTSIVAEARRWLGKNPTDRASLWCARFMNFVLGRLGLPGTASDVAKSFASYGTKLAGPKIGAIAVMTRGKTGGHVGVVSGFDKSGDPIIISGNYSRRVAEAVFARSRVIAYVAPENPEN